MLSARRQETTSLTYTHSTVPTLGCGRQPRTTLKQDCAVLIFRLSHPYPVRCSVVLHLHLDTEVPPVFRRSLGLGLLYPSTMDHRQCAGLCDIRFPKCSLSSVITLSSCEHARRTASVAIPGVISCRVYNSEHPLSHSLND